MKFDLTWDEACLLKNTAIVKANELHRAGAVHTPRELRDLANRLRAIMEADADHALTAAINASRCTECQFDPQYCTCTTTTKEI